MMLIERPRRLSRNICGTHVGCHLWTSQLNKGLRVRICTDWELFNRANQIMV